MILGLRTAIYPVADLQKARQWYESVLGQDPYFDQPFYVGFSVGGFELGLVPEDNASTSGGYAMWGVSNADEELARLIELGATPLEPVTDVGDGIRVASVIDPFGNRFAIIENPHFNAKAVH